MTFNIQKLMGNKDKQVTGSTEFDFSSWDFAGYSVVGPVSFSFVAVPENNAVKLSIQLDAKVEAECVRCLKPLCREQHVEKTYVVDAAEFQNEFPELPLVNGELDLQELAYGELVLEVPMILLCKEDCQGLCAGCGKLKQDCDCPPQEQGDPRWQILKQLLN